MGMLICAPTNGSAIMCSAMSGTIVSMIYGMVKRHVSLGRLLTDKKSLQDVRDVAGCTASKMLANYIDKFISNRL